MWTRVYYISYHRYEETFDTLEECLEVCCAEHNGSTAWTEKILNPDGSVFADKTNIIDKVYMEQWRRE